MKTTLLAIALLPLFSLAQSQNQTPVQPQKFDNTVIVTGTSFAQVKTNLLDRGIFIDQQNEQDYNTPRISDQQAS